MSLARGLGAAFEGFSKGVRLAREEEESKTRQELARRQIEAADLQLEQSRRERDYQNEIKALQNEAAKSAQGGQSGEVVDEFGVNLGRMTYMGGNRPEAGGLQFTGETQQIAPRNPATDPQYAQELLNRENEIKVKYGKMSRIDALKGIGEFGKLMNAGAFDAGNYFLSSGDEAGALKMLRDRGGMNIPEGTRLVKKQEKLFAEGPDADWNKRDSFLVVGPDGNQLADWGAITRRAMDPKDLLSMQTEQGRAMMNFIYQTKSLAETTRHNTETERLRGLDIANQARQYEIVLGRMDMAARAQTEQLAISRDLRAAQVTQGVMSQAQKEVFNLTGFQPIKGEELQYMPENKKSEYFDRLSVAGTAQSIFEGNFDLKGNKAGVTPAMSVELAKAYSMALRDPKEREAWASRVKTNEDGLNYIEIGKQRVLVPAVPGATSAAPASTATPKPEQRRGVTPPQQNPAAPPPVQVPNGGDPLARATDAQLEAAAKSGNRYAEQELARRRSLYRGAPAADPQYGINPGI